MKNAKIERVDAVGAIVLRINPNTAEYFPRSNSYCPLALKLITLCKISSYVPAVY